MAHHYAGGSSGHWTVFVESCGGYDDPQEITGFATKAAAERYAYEADRDEVIHMAYYERYGRGGDFHCPCPLCLNEPLRCGAFVPGPGGASAEEVRRVTGDMD